MTAKASHSLFATTSNESFGVELDDKQKRLLKQMQAMLVQTLTAEDEKEYFEATAALMKKAVEIVHAANYAKVKANYSTAEQAVEFAMDFAHEEEINNPEYDN